MSFLWPVMLVFLLFVPICGVLYLFLQRRRGHLTEKYGGFGLVQRADGSRLGIRRHIPPALFLSGLAVLMVALARPQAVVSLPREEGIVILAFDVSGSMAAEDLEPTRMEASKSAAQEFVQRQPPGVQIGVVAFSDGGLGVQPPTNDQETIRAAINRLAPQRGTSIGEGIRAALNAIALSTGQASLDGSEDQELTLPTPTPVPTGTYTPAVIVLLTDGENTAPPNPYEAAVAAADRGVRIYTIGVGSAAGTSLNVNGFTVHTQLDEATLQSISEVTGGEYYNAGNQEELQAIYENLTPQWVIKPQNMEITSIFAGASILLLLSGGMISLLWFSRLP